MKKDALELVFILDRSGSMSNLVEDTIGGFNSTLAHQKESSAEILLTTVLFNNSNEIIHDRIPVEQAEILTEKEYVPGGTTALYDAIGSTIDHLEIIHKYIRPEDVPEKTMIVIITDGLENASTEYNISQIREMIEEKRANKTWEFIFLGANIDSFAVSEQMGIRKVRTANYDANQSGVRHSYRSARYAIDAYLDADAEYDLSNLPF